MTGHGAGGGTGGKGGAAGPGGEGPSIHLRRREAELLGLEAGSPSREGAEAYPHDLPEGAFTEEMMAELFLGDGAEDSMEDMDEAISDALDRSGEEGEG